MIVVNDGSRDKTAGVLIPYVKKGDIKVFNQSNAGKTAALMRGI